MKRGRDYYSSSYPNQGGGSGTYNRPNAGGGTGSFNRNSTGSFGGGGGARSGKCYKCGQEGHWASNCPQAGGNGGAPNMARNGTYNSSAQNNGPGNAAYVPRIQGPKVYAVAAGSKIGIFDNWGDCKKSIDNYSGGRPIYKSFASVQEARQFMMQKGVRSFDIQLHGFDEEGFKDTSDALRGSTADEVESNSGDEMGEDDERLCYNCLGDCHSRCHCGFLKKFRELKRRGAENSDDDDDGDDLLPDLNVSPTEKNAAADWETMKLTDDQQKVFDMAVHEGKNVFITGNAGTGKSVLVKKIIKALKDKYTNKGQGGENIADRRIAVTASTGVSAIPLGGTTLHAWSSYTVDQAMGVKKPNGQLFTAQELEDRRAGRVARDPEKYQRTRTLIIDEISMVEPKHFSFLERMCCEMRKSGMVERHQAYLKEEQRKNFLREHGARVADAEAELRKALVMGSAPPPAAQIGTQDNAVDVDAEESSATTTTTAGGADSAFAAVKELEKKVSGEVKDESCFDQDPKMDDVLLRETANGKDFYTTPFGGIQIIVAGDFLQLPPVTDQSNGTEGPTIPSLDPVEDSKHLFETKAWKRAGFVEYCLTQTLRQDKGDQSAFIDALTHSRMGTAYMKESHHATFEKATKKFRRNTGVLQPSQGNLMSTQSTGGGCDNSSQKGKGLEKKDIAVRLRGKNRDVTTINDSEYQRVRKRFKNFKERHFIALEAKNQTTRNAAGADAAETAMRDLKKGCRVEQKLDLAVGTRVMLVQNLDVQRGLVNGSCGTIVDFVKNTHKYAPKRDGNKPLDVGDHFTGQLFPLVRFDSAAGFPTQLKVVLPHAWSMGDTSSSNKPPLANADILQEAERLRLRKFVRGEKLGPEAEKTIRMADGLDILAMMVQIPLIKCWSVTIHKSQGLSVDKLEVDLSKNSIFEDGQAYVAVSRVRSLEGLTIVNYNRDAFRANSEVVSYYTKLLRMK